MSVWSFQGDNQAHGKVKVGEGTASWTATGVRNDGAKSTENLAIKVVGDKLIVKGEDTLVKRPITIPFDMVIHAIGMDPNVDNPEIAKTFGIDLEFTEGMQFDRGYMSPYMVTDQDRMEAVLATWPGPVTRLSSQCMP